MYLIEPSIASRRPVPRKRGSRVGFVVDPFRLREIVFESGLEEQNLYAMIADPDVAVIEEQVAPVAFRDRDGAVREHCFDARVTRVDGRRIAIAVKYSKDAIACDLAGTLASIADQAFETNADDFVVPFADEYRIVTERHLDADRVANAALVVSCGGDFDVEARRVVLDWLPGAPERFALRDVGLATGLGSRGFRVAVALIQAGAIALAEPGRIGSQTMVVNRLFNPR